LHPETASCVINGGAVRRETAEDASSRERNYIFFSKLAYNTSAFPSPAGVDGSSASYL